MRYINTITITITITRNQRVNRRDASISASTRKGNRSFFLCLRLCMRRCVARVYRDNASISTKRKPSCQRNAYSLLNIRVVFIALQRPLERATNKPIVLHNNSSYRIFFLIPLENRVNAAYGVQCLLCHKIEALISDDDEGYGNVRKQ